MRQKCKCDAIATHARRKNSARTRARMGHPVTIVTRHARTPHTPKMSEGTPCSCHVIAEAQSPTFLDMFAHSMYSTPMKPKITETGRTCTKCFAFKEWEHFTRMKHGPRGHTTQCKPCRRAHEAAKRAAAKTITLEELRNVLEYDADTGVFFWLKRGRGRSSVAGCASVDGYVRVRINGKYYGAHRLAWFYVYGEWPPYDVDHINRDRSDNRLCNLRLATRSENMQNRELAPTRGVSKTASGKYRAEITVNKQRRYLGVFGTMAEAVEARRRAEEELLTHGPL